MSPQSATGEPLRESPGDRPRNLLELIHHSVRRWPDHEAIRWRQVPAEGPVAASAWKSWTFAELWDQVRAVSLGLRGLGLVEGDRVVILGRSRPEWLVADLASLALGAVTCPIQPSEPPARIASQLRRLAPRLVIVENDHLLHRLRRGTGEAFDVPAVGMEPLAGSPGHADSLAQLAAAADRSPEAARTWEAEALAIDPSRLATIVHTMADDGEPRGAMLTHGNVVHSCMAATQAVPISMPDVLLSVLPLSHMFERGCGVIASLGVGATVVFADHSMERWASEMAAVRPTVMCCVPAFYQEFEDRIRSRAAGRPAYARGLFRWAAGVGRRCDTLREEERRMPLRLRLQWAFARRVVLSAVHRAFGGRLRWFISGGAPLPAETGRFFASLGITMLEGYGLTEAAPLLTVNRPGEQRFGSVGPPIPETEIRIAPDTEEVLARGPQVMLGYLDLPAVNERMIDADGWLHTGDRGALDASGRLRITGRIKDLIVLATGKKVAPAAIERCLLGSPLIAQAVVVGDAQDAIGVLIVPTGVEDGGGEVDVGQMHREVERLTSELAAYERPRRVALLPRRLSVEAGELAPDGSPRREAVVAHFPEAVAALIGSQEAGPGRTVISRRPRA